MKENGPINFIKSNQLVLTTEIPRFFYQVQYKKTTYFKYILSIYFDQIYLYKIWKFEK